MAIKAIINNTEKEIEQIKNSNEQDIDYVYSRIGDTEVEGAPPISIKSIGGNLADYRIYGNTVDGESVGDRTGNLFDGEVELGSWDIDARPCSKINGYNVRIRNANFIKVAKNFTYSVTISAEENVSLKIHFLDAQYNYISETAWLNNISNFNTPSQCEYINIIFKKGNNDAIALSDIFNIMLNSGSTPLPYEPFGYKVPVTVSNGTDTLTTPIYLPEPIKMVGDEAEYIDYGEQKQHRVRKNLLKNTATSQTVAGVTFTVNSDGSVALDGKCTSGAYVRLIDYFDIPAGTYTLTGAPSNSSQYSNFRIYLQTRNENPIHQYVDAGDGITFSVNDTTSMALYVALSPREIYDFKIYPMIRKADIEDDTYEPYIENTEVDVTLPALSTIKGTNILSVNTSIQPSNIYIKDNFDYKKVFTATRTIEDELPLNYRNIEDNDSTLDNYRIYGNTVSGESVGDLVESGEHAGEYSVPVTVTNGTDAETTNLYLPEQIKMVGDEAEYVDYEEQKQHRVRKNLLQNTAKSQTINGVTFTVNSDGSVTCNGTSTSRYFSLFRIPCYLVAGEYIISGCPDGGDSGTYRADIRISPNGTMISSYMDIGVGATIVIDESGWYDYTIRIQGGYTVDNITFKPMIRKANIEDDTYEPYIENVDLDVTLPALPVLPGTNVLTVGTEVQPSSVEIKGHIK